MHGSFSQFERHLYTFVLFGWYINNLFIVNYGEMSRIFATFDGLYEQIVSRSVDVSSGLALHAG